MRLTHHSNSSLIGLKPSCLSITHLQGQVCTVSDVMFLFQTGYQIIIHFNKLHLLQTRPFSRCPPLRSEAEFFGVVVSLLEWLVLSCCRPHWGRRLITVLSGCKHLPHLFGEGVPYVHDSGLCTPILWNKHRVKRNFHSRYSLLFTISV